MKREPRAAWRLMSQLRFFLYTAFSMVLAASAVGPLAAQTAPPASTPNSQQAAPPQSPKIPAAPTRADILRGPYGPYRANNDLLYYHLDVRVDPEKKTIAGKNTIRFKMLKDGSRIQIDLRDILSIDKILLDKTELNYERQADSVFIDFPQTLKSGQTYSIDFHYHGTPTPIGRFGGIVFQQDPAGRPWVFTAC